jgi:hypothetical protein
MAVEDATGPVGVINIDLADFEPAGDVLLSGGESHDDATLAQALTRLAARGTDSLARPAAPRPADHCPRLQGGRLKGRLAPFWADATRVRADLGALSAELEQAVSQILRRIAASR